MKKALGILALSLLSACGEGPTPPPPPPPPPARASVTVTGDGYLVVHPSINPAYAVALATPVRIIETGGGSADWNFARMSLFRGGAEIERAEIGANDLRSSGFGPIGATTNRKYDLVFRLNSSEFDAFAITLGFSDTSDGRQLTVPVNVGTFTGVDLSLVPMSLKWSKLPL